MGEFLFRSLDSERTIGYFLFLKSFIGFVGEKSFAASVSNRTLFSSSSSSFGRNGPIRDNF